MSSHANIIVSGQPKGVFIEGILSGTPKPGQAVEVVAATEPVSGNFTWRVYQPGTDGDQRIVAVLYEDGNQGKLKTDAYVSGDVCFIYCPIPGELIQMLAKNESGTADAFAIGDILDLDTGTGKVQATTGGESEPFVAMETLAGITADTHLLCMFTGY